MVVVSVADQVALFHAVPGHKHSARIALIALLRCTAPIGQIHCANLHSLGQRIVRLYHLGKGHLLTAYFQQRVHFGGILPCPVRQIVPCADFLCLTAGLIHSPQRLAAVIIGQHTVIEVRIIHSHAAPHNGQTWLHLRQQNPLRVVGIDSFPAIIAGFIVIIKRQQIHFIPIAVAERHVAVAPRGAGCAVMGAAGQIADRARIASLLVDGIDQRTTHRVGIVDFPVVEHLIIHAVRSGGQQPQGAAADALQLLGGGCCGFRGRSRCRRAVRCGLSAGCQGQRQRGSDSKIFLHDISSPYCVFSAAKVCGVMLAAESVTLYPLAFATA